MSTDTHPPIQVRRGGDRGLADFGWLESRHTFSFGQYQDPAQMGFRSLRVINEDRVAARKGFATHPHRDMEIFSYVLAGELQHEDSLGNGRTLEPGQIQLMSAGRGVTHSEYNPSEEHGLHFLQIWIEPREKGLTPGYTEWHPHPAQSAAPKVLVISPDGREGSATIQQDAEVRRLLLPARASVSHRLADGRGLWLQVMRGSLELGGIRLTAGDGACTDEAGTYEVAAVDDAEALLFDLC